MAIGLGEVRKLPREAKRVADLKKEGEGDEGEGEGVGGGVGEGDVVGF